MEPLRILLVDDHILFRKGLASLLSSRLGVQVVGEAGDGLEAIARARETRPDLILMDIGMPGCNGLEATQRIKCEMPGVQIIMLTVSDDDQDLFAAIKGGAQGYLLKNMEPGELFEMLEGARRGEAAISGVLAAKILQEFRAPAQDLSQPAEASDELTPREIEVLEQVVQAGVDCCGSDGVIIIQDQDQGLFIRAAALFFSSLLQKSHEIGFIPNWPGPR